MYLNKVIMLKIAIFTTYGLISAIVLSGIISITGRSFFTLLEMFMCIFLEIILIFFISSLFEKLKQFKNSELKDLVVNKEHVNTFLFGTFLRIINMMAYISIGILLANRIQLLWTGGYV